MRRTLITDLNEVWRDGREPYPTDCRDDILLCRDKRIMAEREMLFLVVIFNQTKSL